MRVVPWCRAGRDRQSAPGKRPMMVGAPKATSSVRFYPATGEAFTHPYPGRGGAHWVDFLDHVETWIPSTTKRVYAIMDNLSSHRTTDVLLFLLGHPRWEMMFQPKYAAYLNLIEPWWKILRSLALAGRRFETWDEIIDAIHRSTVYWNAHRHPFVWGKRRRHRPRRSPGIALLLMAHDLPDEPLRRCGK